MRTNVLSGSTAVLFAAFTLVSSKEVTWPMAVLGVAFLLALVLSLVSAHRGDPDPLPSKPVDAHDSEEAP